MTFCIPVKGVFVTNCYFAIDRKTNHGFLIDPGAEGEKLVQLILEHDWIIEKILLTHGHFDHFGGVDAVRDALDIPILIHEEGKAYLERPELNLSRFCGGDLTVEGAKYFRDGDLLTLREGGLRLKAIHTPGHQRHLLLDIIISNAIKKQGTTCISCTMPALAAFAKLSSAFCQR